MTTPNQNQVLSTLCSYAGVLVGSVMKGWEESQGVALNSPWLKKRTRANVVWDRIVMQAISSFADDSRVIVQHRNETVNFLVDEAVLFRFKKGDSNGLSSNYPTQHAIAFHDHEQDLFGQPKIQRVDVVYRLNPLETQVVDVLVVARDGDQILWISSLMEADGMTNVIPLHTNGSDSGVDAARRMIKTREANADTYKKSNAK